MKHKKTPVVYGQDLNLVHLHQLIINLGQSEEFILDPSCAEHVVAVSGSGIVESSNDQLAIREGEQVALEPSDLRYRVTNSAAEALNLLIYRLEGSAYESE